ncbi:MAG: M16 family metallopeptidase [Vulcanimicrobiaceae bacterium]
MISRFSAMLCAALAAGMPFAVSAASTAPPSVAARLERSGGVTFIRQQDDAASLVGAQVVLRAGLDRQTLRQSGLAALVAQTILNTPVAGSTMSLKDAISARGGSIHFSIDPDDVRFYVESLPSAGTAVFSLFARALAAPSIKPATVRAARSDLFARIARDQSAALAVGLDMLDRANAGNANAALPTLGTSASLAQLVPGDVQAFYGKYYRRGGAYVSAVGRIDALAHGALTQLADAVPAGSTSAIAVHIAPLEGTSRQLITHRDIQAPWLIAQYAAPNADSKDFGPMLVLAAFMQRTLADIVEVPGVVSPTFASNSVGSLYDYSRQPASLTLYVNGGMGNPDRAFGTALSIVKVLATTKLTGSIEDFKAMAYGDFATGATTLESRAWLATVFAEQVDSPDYIARAMQAISTTTPADIQRVAKLYLDNPTIALVLPRQQQP